MKKYFKKIISYLPVFNKLIKQRDQLLLERDQIIQVNNQLKSHNEHISRRLHEEIYGNKGCWVPPGHFYSPIYNKKKVVNYNKLTNRYSLTIEDRIPSFDTKIQIEIFKKLSKYFKDFNFPSKQNSVSRYFVDNGSYEEIDGLILASFIRYLKPKRIVEIGSGNSSALMLDINEKYFNGKIDLTFIDPYPETLKELSKPDDLKKNKLIHKQVQSVDLSVFQELEANDILFIDSTHVSKYNSDVNFEIFEILPILAPGVIIHFHDVFYPFEYPKEWIREGRSWNEIYLLKAFLLNNYSYKILLMNTYFFKIHRAMVNKYYPSEKSNVGGSLWLKKLK